MGGGRHVPSTPHQIALMCETDAENVDVIFGCYTYFLKIVSDKVMKRVSQFLEKLKGMCKRLTNIPYETCTDYFNLLEGWLCGYFKSMFITFVLGRNYQQVLLSLLENLSVRWTGGPSRGWTGGHPTLVV